MYINKNDLNFRYNKMEGLISHICNNEYKYFLNKANVVGVGCGYKVQNGFRTNQLCVQVFVSRKVSKYNISQNDIIPLIYKGIETDVIESGFIKAYSLISRIRPVLGGYCVSSANNEHYGTISCLVTNGISNFLLSTNHILAGENIFNIGTPIIQPSHYFGGFHPNDTIATLHKYIPLRSIEGTHEPINLTDCALGLLTKRNILTPEIALIGRLKGVKKTVKLNDEVKKVGCTSELTIGIVNSVFVTATITLPSSKRYLFENLIITTSMMSDGDSGSILVNKHNYGIGLGFAGNSNVDVYCSLDTVLDQLDVKLVT